MRTFISYVADDKPIVDTLCENLGRLRVEYWHDDKMLSPGARWKANIRQAIEESDNFIACFSTSYWNRQKTYMNDELLQAVEQIRIRRQDETWFIPVLLEECDVPAIEIGGGQTLLDFQWVPLFADWNFGVRRIVDTIRPPKLMESRRQIDNLALIYEEELMQANSADDLSDFVHDDANRAKAVLSDARQKHREEFGEDYVPSFTRTYDV